MSLFDPYSVSELLLQSLNTSLTTQDSLIRFALALARHKECISDRIKELSQRHDLASRAMLRDFRAEYARVETLQTRILERCEESLEELVEYVPLTPKQ